ncbi:MAG: hypothetical protein J5I81_01180 [Nitrococcus mobilis]|nr:hypothetical protein [Nitrococcus mobilis]
MGDQRAVERRTIAMRQHLGQFRQTIGQTGDLQAPELGTLRPVERIPRRPWQQRGQHPPRRQ